MATQPTFLLKSAFAENGEKTIIPATKQELGQFSQSVGFPPETSAPLAQGGIPPRRQDFNGAFWMLSKMLMFYQNGGIYKWSKDLDYPEGCLIIGSNNRPYFCIKENGASGTVVDPTTDSSGTYWDAIPTELTPTKHRFVDFTIVYGDWRAFENTNYGTHYKVSISATCETIDVVHAYFDAQSYLPAQASGIIPDISVRNTLDFYAKTKPTVNIAGKYEILKG